MDITNTPSLKHRTAWIIGLGLVAVLLLLPSWKNSVLFPGGNSVIAHRDSDVWPHLWGFWWIGQSIIQGNGIPFSTSLLKYPTGGVLYFPDLFGALLSTPFQLWLSAEQAFNLVLVLKLFLLGLSVYLLCLHISGNRTASFLAGTVMISSPFFLAEIYNGISEVLNFGWPVLFLLSLLKLEEGRRSAAISAALFFFLTFLGNWYYTLVCGICAVLWLASLVLFKRRGLKRALPLALLAAVLAAGLVYPLAGILSRTLKADAGIVKRDHTEVMSLFENEHNLVDVLSFVMPGDFHSPDLKKKFGESFLHISYLGLVFFISAAAGFKIGRKRAGPFWIMVLIFFFVMTLGPFLYVNGRIITMGDTIIKLPFYYFFEYVPFFDVLGHPQRLLPFATLSLAVLASLAWKRLFSKVSFPRTAAVLLFAALMAENLWISPAPFPLDTARFPIDPYLKELGTAAGGGGAVIDLPVKYHPYWLNTRYFYHQLYHGLSITYTVNSPCTTLKTTLAANPFVSCLLNIDFNNIYRTTWSRREDVKRGAAALAGAGFTHVLVHKEFYQERKTRDRTADFLNRTLGAPVHSSDVVEVYELKTE